jgi:hypothetical protein
MKIAKFIFNISVFLHLRMIKEVIENLDIVGRLRFNGLHLFGGLICSVFKWEGEKLL